MLTKEQIIKIITSTNLTDIEILKLIEQYIFDTKNIKVEINRPRDLMNLQLMQIAFEKACEYYGELYR